MNEIIHIRYIDMSDTYVHMYVWIYTLTLLGFRFGLKVWKVHYQKGYYKFVGGFCATYKYVWKIQKIIVPCGQFVPCWSTYKMFHFNAAVSQLMTTPIYCYPTHCMHIYVHMYVYLKHMNIFVCALVYYVNKSRVTEIKLIASISIHIYICISTYVQKDISTLIFTNAYM